MSDPSKLNKGLLIALTVSLSINLFIAGFAVSRALKPEHGPRPPHAGLFERGGFDFRGHDPLPPDLRHKLASEMREQRDALRAVAERAHDVRREVHDLMSAEEFDAEALEEALAELRSLESSAKEIMHGVMAEAAAEMTAAEREVLAARETLRKRIRERIRDRHAPAFDDRLGPDDRVEDEPEQE